MFINFNGFDDLNELCTITVHLGNAVVQQTQLPLLFCQQQFMQLIQEISKDNRPMKVQAVRQEYTEEGRVLHNSLTFQNNSYVREFETENT
jgi:hypothetical protein